MTFVSVQIALADFLHAEAKVRNYNVFHWLYGIQFERVHISQGDVRREAFSAKRPGKRSLCQ